MPRRFFAFLWERCLYNEAAQALAGVCLFAGRMDYTFISVGYQRTDVARMRIVQEFMRQSASPQDLLVMLDADHAHPADILPRLERRGEGVVGALAVKRNAPHYPCALVRRADGKFTVPDNTALQSGALLPVTMVGTGAICIRRHVIQNLQARAGGKFLFRYDYPEDVNDFQQLPADDNGFGALCEQAGIQHYLDTSIVTPHLAVVGKGLDDWIADTKPGAVQRGEKL